jgi:hypothetical protein
MIVRKNSPQRHREHREEQNMRTILFFSVSSVSLWFVS